MARVTVEDCITKIPNHFDLVVYAAQRTRQISSGAPLTIERGDDKFPVVALREIAESTVTVDQLHEATVNSYRKHLALDDAEQEMADMLTEEQDMSRGAIEIGGESMEEALEIVALESQVSEAQVSEAKVSEAKVSKAKASEAQANEAQVSKTKASKKSKSTPIIGETTPQAVETEELAEPTSTK